MQSVIPPSGNLEDSDDVNRKRCHVRWTPETLRTLVFAFRVLKSAARSHAQVRSASTWARVASVVMALHHLSSLNGLKCKKRFNRLEREYRAFCDLMALEGFEARPAGTLLASDDAWHDAITKADAATATLYRRFKKTGFPLYEEMKNAMNPLPSVRETNMRDEALVQNLLASAAASRQRGAVAHALANANASHSAPGSPILSPSLASPSSMDLSEDLSMGPATVPDRQASQQLHQVPCSPVLPPQQIQETQLQLDIPELSSGLLASLTSGSLTDVLNSVSDMESFQTGTRDDMEDVASPPPPAQEDFVMRLVHHILDITALGACDDTSLCEKVVEERVTTLKALHHKHRTDPLLLQIVETQVSRSETPDNTFRILEEFLHCKMPYAQRLRQLYPLASPQHVPQFQPLSLEQQQ